MTNNTLPRYTLIASLFCFTVLAICYTYGAHLGLNSRITAGFDLDANSISIALSRLWFHLHEGYVGYQQIHTSLFQVLVPDTNPNNPDNFALLSNPQAIQMAFDNVKKILPVSLPAFSVLSPQFVSIMMEDVGLSDYYTLSFLIFGAHPTSMYNLYFLLFASSILLFAIEYKRQFFPMVLLASVVSLFPIFFFSDFFNILIPSVNSNRFLSTLGFIPIAYALCIYFKPKVDLNRWQVARLACQALLFAFALSIRRPAQWQLIGFALFAGFIAVKVFWPYRSSLFQLERLRLLKHPVLAAAIIFVGIVSSYQAIQQKMLNPLYHTDASPAGHAFWHSAYVGLAMHPHWPEVNPSPTANTDVGDGIALHPFEKYMKDRGLPALSHITNTYQFGLHEIVTKQGFFRFIKSHKMFTLKLYAYYKPRAILLSLWARIKMISTLCSIYCLLASIIIGYIFAAYAPDKKNIRPRQFLIVASLFFAASCLPGLFAYPRMENGDDLWMLAIFASFNVSMLTYVLVNRFTEAAKHSLPLSNPEETTEAA